MPETIYHEDEVYLTEEQVNDACHGYEKADMVYNLIRRLQKNEVYVSAKEVDEIISRCAEELKSHTLYG